MKARLRISFDKGQQMHSYLDGFLPYHHASLASLVSLCREFSFFFLLCSKSHRVGLGDKTVVSMNNLVGRPLTPSL